MHRLFDVDNRRVAAMVREFSDEMGFATPPVFDCVYKSGDYPKDRQVFKLTVGEDAFALKLDFQSHLTKRLETEFAILTRIHAHLASYERVSTLKPLYLAQDRRFFVTPYQDRKTANQIIRTSQNANSVKQVFRRAGEWLSALHDYQPPAQTPISPNWMIGDIESLLKTGAPKAPRAEVRRLLKLLHSQTERAKGSQDLKAFCHGDFHGSNLILGAGETFGFDFTESKEKLALYDIVDFLKSDIFAPAEPDDIDRSGIQRVHKDMFFKLYRHDIDMDLLDLCLRGRLLLDWASISEQSYRKSAFQRRKYDLLEQRLQVAFR